MRTEALKFQTIGSPAIIIIQWRIWSEEEREVRIPFLLSFDSLKEREGEVRKSVGRGDRRTDLLTRVSFSGDNFCCFINQ
jgi:hypothetical protein